jgi:hypothetical protein
LNKTELNSDFALFPIKDPRQFFVKINLTTLFYLPLMEYEGSIGLLSIKMKHFFAHLNYLGLFMIKLT